MVPVSTCLSDPAWFRPPHGQEYFIDKRGIVNGLRYKPLIVQDWSGGCPCEEHNPDCCTFLKNYKEALLQVDMEKTLKAFNHCANKFVKNGEEPIIVLIVYEPPNKLCSERKVLQEVFNCTELKYPIK